MSPSLLRLLIAREWRRHPWRHATVLLAVALGVALAWSVHLINGSALAEFASAARATGGEPDLTLRARRLDDALYERVAADAAVALASPVLELDTYALAADGSRVALRVLGIDALLAPALAPGLLPRPAVGEDRLAILDPDAVFANAAARTALGARDGGTLAVQSGPDLRRLRLAGSVAAAGTPLLVMDIAGAQAHFDAPGRLSRIDLRLHTGADPAPLQARLALPAGVTADTPEQAQLQGAELSRAYRVNLTALAGVALFVGAFLVFSVTALSVAQRTPTFALLGVLGLTARQRRLWVLAECALLGTAGSVLGLLAGAGLAALALHGLGGDLGAGALPGSAAALHVPPADAAGFVLLGVASALAGGWWPARQAQALAPAQALKGLGAHAAHVPRAWPGLVLLALGAGAALLPPVAGLPLAAYASVAAILLGGVVLVPAVVQGLLALLPAPRAALPLLALQRARVQRTTATAAVAGVVASLALSVALTVMVTSFREGVSQWLERVLPADVYARSAGSASAAEQAWFDPGLAERAARLPGVARVQSGRARPLVLAAGQPPVTLLARPLAQPDAQLPLLQPALPPPLPASGEVGVFVSEAVVARHGAAPGTLIALPLPLHGGGSGVAARVRGVWRDYARPLGSVAIDASDYRRLTGDERITELALWLAPGADAAAVQQALRDLLPGAPLMETATTGELRAMSLRIFDRSFVVTRYLQAVAVFIGLVGVATSLAAQVLARRKEFGLLVHLGLTRRQVVIVVAAEGAAWMAAGCAVGLLLGVAVSTVLVFVVNPQSFHWSMELVLPWPRLLLLCAAVWAAGTATAGVAARGAAARRAVLSVKEDG